MPLSFSSLSHGTIAFGFYNIETDGLLLDRHFFFSTDFCRAVEELAQHPPGTPAESSLDGHMFRDPTRIGDLMGAIHGLRHVGYLGELYKVWPFPADPRDFRQKLHGEDNRAVTLAQLDRVAVREEIRLVADPGFERVQIGPYGFSRAGFIELLRYVVRGGYPTWEGYEQGAMPLSARQLVPVITRLEPLG